MLLEKACNLLSLIKHLKKEITIEKMETNCFFAGYLTEPVSHSVLFEDYVKFAERDKTKN